ncbi:hypothetical protein SARC_15497, partial [Sphaeroforma arctica JP610]
KEPDKDGIDHLTLYAQEDYNSGYIAGYISTIVPVFSQRSYSDLSGYLSKEKDNVSDTQ